ncbi:uncharacterized protein GABPI isoform X2 [Panulirus ornatus]|uniref:uncharacterized protein GABPI isoform X2 n=1 Tax=Panulirus ornatus TaxID=150431 RepID=UPI003A8B11E6
MPKRDDIPLCCCEYISEDGERSHLLATFCNCEAIDEAFERLFTLKPSQTESVEKIMDTISDRLRIPWLDTCVSCVNDRWFVIGLAFGLPALCYGAHLSLTAVCHPYLLDLYFTTVLFPHQCPNAFLDLQSSLAISGACYSILLGTFVAVILIQQLVCVVGGVRLREYRQRRQLPGQASFWSFRYAFKNCINFWWR